MIGFQKGKSNPGSNVVIVAYILGVLLNFQKNQDQDMQLETVHINVFEQIYFLR